ncbi:MAG TPA: MOSC domain-containing protein [Nocardioides sp.]|uniref:MOSC domain-containing protein n=1 Tax=Nocardioides sp. TaxID=35761 RepID=UPI002E31F73A|nr:MOSC domain-containing protein [Nocardioides sp.]HEX3931963.1 MOSC domain-containing protein [Nocardioides sp.]
MSRLVRIYVARAARLPMQERTSVEVETGKGIVGDRYHGTGFRQVTVQSAAALAHAASEYGAPVPVGLTRRNLTIDEGEVPTAPGRLIRVGPVLLEVVCIRQPCQRLDDAIGPGVKEVLRGRAGSLCRVLEGGTVQVGDPVDLDAAGA